MAQMICEELEVRSHRKLKTNPPKLLVSIVGTAYFFVLSLVMFQLG